MSLLPEQLSERRPDAGQLNRLGERFPDLSRLSRRLLASRSLDGPAETLTLDRLLSPDTLKNARAGADLLLGALAGDGRILIAGDYDVDGATATTLMVDCLRSDFGARVDYVIPNRFRHGYGLSPALVADCLAGAPTPDLLITVDNGIASHQGIRAAQAAGIQVIVTDHHLPGHEPCPADVVINPNQPGCGFPSKAACGCTVAFYLLLVLRQRAATWLTERGLPRPRLADYLDLVALATIADVVPLDRNNRILVEQGMQRIRSGACRSGLLAILEQAGRDPGTLQSQDLGFTLGPRLNAAGRMDDMSVGVRCLLAANPTDARTLAAELEQFNQARRERQGDMLAQADALTGTLTDQEDIEGRRLCVVWHDDWHEGLVGLVAGQLRERLDRPALALCPAQPPGSGYYKGSARSMPGVHMRDLLAWADAQNPGLIDRFGGHAMAAGLTVPAGRLAELQTALEAAADALVPPEAWTTDRPTDGCLEAGELTLVQAEEIETLGPWGQGCPVPVFVNRFRIDDCRWLSAGQHLRLTLSVLDAATGELHGPLTGIWFRCPLPADTTPPLVLQLVYELQVNRFRGQRQLQLLIRDQVDPGRQQDP